MNGGPATSGAVAHILTDTLDDELRVDGADGHHLARVRRIRVGEHVTAADGAGAWRAYVVHDVTDRSLELRADAPARTEDRAQPDVSVAFALTKGSKPEVVVRQLTEVGVDRILPVVSARSVARPGVARADAFTLRMRKVAREAAMQCRRAWLPDVAPPVPVGSLAGRADLVVAELGAGPVEALADPGPGGWTLLVGPEGGLTPEELQELGPSGRLGLGPHVLRAETAAVAGALVLSTLRQSKNPGTIGHGAWHRAAK